MSFINHDDDFNGEDSLFDREREAAKFGDAVANFKANAIGKGRQKFTVTHDGLKVASGSCPADKVYGEAMHYALQYAQDGGVVDVQFSDDNPWPPSNRNGATFTAEADEEQDKRAGAILARAACGIVLAFVTAAIFAAPFLCTGEDVERLWRAM